MAKRRPPSDPDGSVALRIRGEQPEPRTLTADEKAAERSRAIVKEARQRWQQCADAESAQRASMLQAKKFRAGDQWPEEVKIQRQGGGSVEGQAAQPPRPCLTIDRLSQPVRQMSNTIRTAHFAIEVIPNGQGASEAVADIYEGIVRKIQVDSRDEAPIEWAAEGAIEAGLGWFRIRPVYCHNDPTLTGPEIFDQELVLERIANSLTVYCDPHARKPTKSDALFMFVTEDLSQDEFRIRWPEADFASLEEFSAEGDWAQWITDKTVRVAEYWRVVFEDVEVKLGDKTRKVQKPRVQMFTINAMQTLDEFKWVGSHIPLIPILGEELNVDGTMMLRGVIQEGMDAQRMVNYMYSAAVETVALAPRAPFIVAEGQIDNYKMIWQNANRYNYAYLPYQPTDLMGQQVPPPQRQTAEPPIQAITMILQKSEEAILATTMWGAASLGQGVPGQKSGRAIKYLQQQDELGAANYPDNVHRALVYAGEQLIEVIPKYYDRPGRILHILGENMEPLQAMIQPTQNGQPVQLDPDMLALAQGMKLFFDPNVGKYAVTVDVGKGFATKRNETVAMLSELVGDLPPEQAASITPILIKNMDFPEAKEVYAAALRALPPQLQPPDKQDDPSALKGQLAQAGQVMKQMTQKLEELQQVIQTKQIESQAKLQQTQMEVESRERIAMIQVSAQLSIAGEKVDAENARSFVDALEAKFSSALDAHMERVHKVMDAQHELRLQAGDQSHEQLQLGAQQAHERAMQAADHAHEQTLAAMQPPLGAGGNGQA